MHDSGSVVKDSGHALNNRLTETIDTCQNKVSADQHHVTISQAQVYRSSKSHVFFKLTTDH